MVTAAVLSKPESATMWHMQMMLDQRNVLPRSTAEIPVQPLASELARWFVKGLSLKPLSF
jgi:hypothetical protein